MRNRERHPKPSSAGILNAKHLWHKRAGCSSPEEAPGGRRRAGGVQEGGLDYPSRLSRAKTLQRLSGAWEGALSAR